MQIYRAWQPLQAKLPLSVPQVLPAEVSTQLPAKIEAQSNKPKSTTSAKVPNTMR